MKKIIVKRLFESFRELEKAIDTARKTLETQENPHHEILGRIKGYEEILDKQRNLATALCGHASLGNWEEVSRHVRLINGLSSMIRDDAREVVSGLRVPITQTDRELMLS